MEHSRTRPPLPRGPAIFGVAVGILMIVMWIVFLATGQVPELESGSVEIVLHVAAELVTAVTLLAGGSAMLMRLSGGRHILLIGFGMLLYTLIVSPGYYVDLGETPMVIMFAVLFAATVAFLAILLKGEAGRADGESRQE